MQWWNKYRVAILSGLMIAIVLAFGFTRINGETLPPLHAEYLGQTKTSQNVEIDSTSIRWTELGNSDTVPADFFGSTISLNSDGTIALVGAYSKDAIFHDSGAVYYYRRGRSGWTLRQQLTPIPNETEYLHFGAVIALNNIGNVALISASQRGGYPVSAPKGSAFIFMRSGDTWTQTHRLTTLDATGTFATSLAISQDGDTALIGEPFGVSGIASGRAHIFVRTGITWTRQSVLLADSAGSQDSFGGTVALSPNGDIAFVTGTSPSLVGRVYIYKRTTGLWSLTQTLNGPGQNGDAFGGSIRLSGDGSRLLISSRYRSPVIDAVGVAYLYVLTEQGWHQERVFEPLPEDKLGLEFATGALLSSNGQRVIISGRTVRINDIASPPLIYIYELKSATWELTHRLLSPNDLDSSLTALALDATGTTFFAIGSHFTDTGEYKSVVYEVTDRDDNLILNGDFSAGMQYWGTWGAPTQSAIQHRITNGTFEFYRQSGSQQAVVLQNTGVSLTGGTALEASFLLGNTSSVRKRVSVLLHDADFSDSQICSFWIPPVSSLRRYSISTFTSDAWTSTMFSVYASTADSTGWLQLDNVNMHTSSSLQLDRTLCFDAGLAAPTSIPTTTNVPGTATHTPTTTLVPSECSSLSLSTGVNFVGTNQVQLIINNSFLTPIYLHRVDFRWPTLSAYPNMALSAIALGSAYVWAGTDTTPPTIVGGAPTAWDGNFASGVNLSIAAGTASSSTATALTFIFSNSPLPISNALSPSSFNGTVITIRYGDTFCNLPLNTNGTSTPTPTALLSTLNPTPTPTNTLPSSGPCGEDC
jgi:hypothetical protein